MIGARAERNSRRCARNRAPAAPAVEREQEAQGHQAVGLGLEVLLVPAQRDLVHLAAVDPVLPGGEPGGGDHGVAGGGVEAEVVPDVGDRMRALVSAALREDPDRRIARATICRFSSMIANFSAEAPISTPQKYRIRGLESLTRLYTASTNCSAKASNCVRVCSSDNNRRSFWSPLTTRKGIPSLSRNRCGMP